MKKKNREGLKIESEREGEREREREIERERKRSSIENQYGVIVVDDENLTSSSDSVNEWGSSLESSDWRMG